MSGYSGFPLLGEILRAADLITSAQLEVALQDQKYYQIRLGEIIALHGWLSQETTEFFAEDWRKLTVADVDQPLGYYFQRAALLNEDQIRAILEEQKKMGVRFGSVAVLKGWVKQRTLDYFLENLVHQTGHVSAFQGKQTLKQNRTHLDNENEENDEENSDYSSSLYIGESIIICPDDYQLGNGSLPPKKEDLKRQPKPIIQVPKKKQISKAMAAQKSLDGEDFDLSGALELDLGDFGLATMSEGSISW